MEHIDSFEKVISHLQKKKRKINLLIGNGFSMAYDRKIFSYNALADFVQNLNDETLSKLFSVLKTKNFELIMEQLSTFSNLLSALGAEAAIREKITSAHEQLKKSLLNAIKALHPEHVFKIPEEKMAACAKFLKIFLNSNGHLFSTNYDLLLYWVLMRQSVPNAIDGFGKELENPMETQQGKEPEWSELRWGPNASKQNVHYLHGALPLFDTGPEVIKEKYDNEGFILENIGKRLDSGEYPIFVTAGNGEEKLSHIRHNRYLSNCYDQLCKVDGSVISFGFAFGKYDEHIITALNKATHVGSNTQPKLWSLYIGTYSDADQNYIKDIENKFHMKLYTFDAKTVPLWGA